MAQLLIRDLKPTTIERLKLRAKQHHRSLQDELKAILESAAKLSMTEARELSKAWQKRLGDGPFSDSTELLREIRGCLHASSDRNS